MVNIINISLAISNWNKSYPQLFSQKTGTILCAWHNTTFCYKTGEVRDWIKVSKPAKFLMKTLMKSNKQADGSLDMDPVDIETYPIQVIDGYVWVGLR